MFPRGCTSGVGSGEAPNIYQVQIWSPIQCPYTGLLSPSPWLLRLRQGLWPSTQAHTRANSTDTLCNKARPAICYAVATRRTTRPHHVSTSDPVTCHQPPPPPPLQPPLPRPSVQLAEGVTGVPYIRGGASVYVPPCNDVPAVLAALSARPRASHKGHGSDSTDALLHNTTATAASATMGGPGSWGGSGSGGGRGGGGWSHSRKLAQSGALSCDQPVHVGCFADQGGDRALPTLLWGSPDRMTVTTCAAVARALNYPVFGIQAGTEVRAHSTAWLTVHIWSMCARSRAPLPVAGLTHLPAK